MLYGSLLNALYIYRFLCITGKPSSSKNWSKEHFCTFGQKPTGTEISRNLYTSSVCVCACVCMWAHICVCVCPLLRLRCNMSVFIFVFSFILSLSPVYTHT